MADRRKFLKTSAGTAGAMALSAAPGLLASSGRSAIFGGAAISELSPMPRRFVFIRKSNGIRPDEVGLPSFDEKQKSLDLKKQPLEVDLERHQLPRWMSALEPFKARLSIIQGLSCKMSENGHWSYSSVMGAFKSGRNSLSGIKRATIDFELARLFPSPFGHVELSLTGNYASFRKGIVAGYSAPAPHQRNYCYADPQTAYDELFKSVTNPGAVDSDNAMLRFLEAEENFKAQVLRGTERRKLSQYVQSIEGIRARNRNVEKMSGRIAEYLPDIDKVHAQGGLNASTPEKQKAFTDILVAALVTGLTNVVTYTIDELSTPIKGLPGNEGDHISIHELGHHGGYSGKGADEIREQIRIGHVQQVATIARRLQNVPEGGGTMFDNTMIFYFPENGEGHHSWGTEAPFVVLAGRNCRLEISGRYIRLPYHATPGHKTLGNWYTTLLNAHGNPIRHYGDLDLDMSRKKLEQTGAIQPFLKS
ncbi:MAG: DUF1552 domain-containing protein [Planctomycetota bacterium]|nr:DUF1552 domain-containing protein [Planctomycetota bacterium]